MTIKDCGHSCVTRNTATGYAIFDSNGNLVDRHVCSYVESIDALIPEAYQWAKDNSKNDSYDLDEKFHARMKELGNRAGLRRL